MNKYKYLYCNINEVQSPSPSGREGLKAKKFTLEAMPLPQHRSHPSWRLISRAPVSHNHCPKTATETTIAPRVYSLPHVPVIKRTKTSTIHYIIYMHISHVETISSLRPRAKTSSSVWGVIKLTHVPARIPQLTTIRRIWYW